MPIHSEFKTHCPQCDGSRKCQVLGEKDQRWEHDFMWGSSTHKLLECQGCETIFYYKSSVNSEDHDYEYDTQGNTIIKLNETINTYPSPVQKDKNPEWLTSIMLKDSQLYKIMKEMYSAFESESYILASIGLRTIFERTTEILNIHPGLTLWEKVEKLEQEGYIGSTEKNQLGVVTQAGNSAAHRAWSPNEAEFRSLLVIVESFVTRTILKNELVNSIAESLPQKPTRPPKEIKIQ